MCYTTNSSVPQEETSTKSGQSVKDVLVKLIRVFANLSISEDIGLMLCDEQKCVQYLLHLIGLCESFELSNSLATIVPINECM